MSDEASPPKKPRLSANESSDSLADEMPFDRRRVKVLTPGHDLITRSCQAVVYWMSRDQRVQDNWAMVYAQKLALQYELPLHVTFCVHEDLPHLTQRRWHFMKEGLREVHDELTSLKIPFHVLHGTPAEVLPGFLVKEDISGCLVTDMSPLRFFAQQVDKVLKALPEDSTFYQVDAHNVVPVWEASDKQEYAARTIRPKINNRLSEFLKEFAPISQHPFGPRPFKETEVDWIQLEKLLQPDPKVPVAPKWTPGSKAGLKAVSNFLESRLKGYADSRNNPNYDAVSNLSPWINFGQVSAQRIVLLVKTKRGKDVESFIEELLVRRELSDNFCYYQPQYDSIQGTSDWARKTLDDHKADKREWEYTKEQLADSETHDDLWNAAQRMAVVEGKMHGFLRMYWAKKILEWTASPEEALNVAIFLNDRYNLDGCDPNGFVGCMWSICGVHDQGWTERKVFGKIRYMNYQGCLRKFDVKAFVAKYTSEKQADLKKFVAKKE